MRSNDLRKWVKTYPQGGCLFTQDDAGATVYLIKTGRVQLYHRTHDTQKLVGTVGTGDVLGEKALISDQPYKHSLTARVLEPTEVIEFEPSELPLVEAKFPEFKMRLLATVTARLEKANEFIRILQTPDLKERITRYVRYFFNYNKAHEGTKLPIIPKEIESVLQLAEGTAEEHLKALVDQKALTFLGGEYLVLHQELFEHLVERARR